jgi:uncharacterized membrane protein
VILLGLVSALPWSDCRNLLMTATGVIFIRYFVVLSTGPNYLMEILILNFLVFVGATVLFGNKEHSRSPR